MCQQCNVPYNPYGIDCVVNSLFFGPSSNLYCILTLRYAGIVGPYSEQPGSSESTLDVELIATIVPGAQLYYITICTFDIV